MTNLKHNSVFVYIIHGQNARLDVHDEWMALAVL